MKYFNAVVVFLLFCSLSLSAQKAFQAPAHDFEPGLLLFKLREQYRGLVSAEGTPHEKMAALIAKVGGGTLRKNFPAAKAPGKEKRKNGRTVVDLSRIFELRLTKQHLDIDSLVGVFSTFSWFEWVQPRFVLQPMFTPNDPQLSQQYHHNLIKTFAAWDITQGDSNVVIAITDAGIQFDHNDLQNIKYNYADPINGVDDDLDGYTDNFRGWNAVNHTNDPTATLSPHGIFTAGMSSATVNNNLGVAGAGYKCKYLPIRIDNESGFNYGYEGIVYAADMGCAVINASWGSTKINPLGAEVVRYAQERNCLIVAAAGNTGTDVKYFPASYPGVLSVGATGTADIKWSNSTFGPRIDIAAPGENVRSTWPFNGYNSSSGTSFSAPLVSAAAALVKSKFPAYNALQLAERLKVTADTSIYTLPENAAWHHLMGAGRLNVYRALTDPERPSIHFYQRGFSDDDGNQFASAGDEISMHGIFKNYLSASRNLKVSMQCASPYIEMLDSTFLAGVIASGDSLSNTPLPFRFRIKANAPYNLDILLKLTYSDSNYRAFEYIEFLVNKDYMNLDVNQIHTTISSRGNTGYAADFAQNGQGFVYKGEQLMYYSGLMLGSAETKTADNAYGSTLPGYDADFVRLQGVRSTSWPGAKSISSAYNTDSAASQRIEVKHFAEAFSNPAIDKVVFLHYTLINQGNDTLNNLHSGIFTDWDIRQSDENQAWFLPAEKLAFAHDTGVGTIYAGVRHLSNLATHGYAFNSDGASGSINLFDGYSDEEKFNTLSGDSVRIQSTVGDIASLIGTGSVSIAPGDSITISYAMLAGESYEALIEQSRQAQGMYHYSSLDVYQTVIDPTCALPSGAVLLNFKEQAGIEIYLLNNDRVTLKRDSGALSSFVYQGLPAGNYFIRYIFADQTSWETTISISELMPVEANAEANPPATTLAQPEIQFQGNATHAESYLWQFGDGDSANVKDPFHTYTDTGTYQVKFIAYNQWCADTVMLQVIVGSTVSLETIRNNVSLYPVPASHELWIKTDKASQQCHYRIYNSLGACVASGMLWLDSSPLNLTAISEGMYFLELQLPEGNCYRAFSVVKP